MPFDAYGREFRCAGFGEKLFHHRRTHRIRLLEEFGIDPVNGGCIRFLHEKNLDLRDIGQRTAGRTDGNIKVAKRAARGFRVSGYQITALML